MQGSVQHICVVMKVMYDKGKGIWPILDDRLKEKNPERVPTAVILSVCLIKYIYIYLDYNKLNTALIFSQILVNSRIRYLPNERHQ